MLSSLVWAYRWLFVGVCLYVGLFMGLFVHLAAPHYAYLTPPTKAGWQNKRPIILSYGALAAIPCYI